MLRRRIKQPFLRCTTAGNYFFSPVIPQHPLQNSAIHTRSKDKFSNTLELPTLSQLVAPLKYTDCLTGEEVAPFPYDEFPVERPDETFCEGAVSEEEQTCFQSIQESRDVALSSSHELNALATHQFNRLHKTKHAFRFFSSTIPQKERKKFLDYILSLDRTAIARGVVFSCKDLRYRFVGFPHTQGSLFYESNSSSQYDAIVRGFLKHGGLFLGTTSNPEFGIGGVTTNRLTGWARNPFNPKMTTGGSSGGSAGSIALGIGNVSLANDGAGSIRIPASFTGTVGLKPTSHFPLFGSLSRHDRISTTSNGFITRTIQDLADVLDIASATDELNFPFQFAKDVRNTQGALNRNSEEMSILTKSLQSLTIGFIPNFPFVTTMDEKVANTVESAVKTINMYLKECNLPEVVKLDASSILTHDPIPHAETICEDRISSIHPPFMKHNPSSKDKYTNIFEDHKRNPEKIEQSKKIRDHTIFELDNLFKKYDIILMPTLPVAPFPVGLHRSPHSTSGKSVDFSWNPFTFLFNWSDQSALSLPCGYIDDQDGLSLPVGLQIIVCKGYQRKNKVAEEDVRFGIPVEEHAKDLKNLLYFAALSETALWEHPNYGFSNAWERRPYYPTLRYKMGASRCTANKD